MTLGIMFTIIASTSIQQNYNAIVETEKEETLALFIIETNKAIHGIVLERALAGYFVAIPDINTKRKLVAQYVDTDQAVSKLSSWTSLTSTRKQRFQSKIAFQRHLRMHRFKIKSNVVDEARVYTELIAHLTDWFEVTAQDINSGTMWWEMVDIFDIIIKKLSIGMSLVYGMSYFVKGGFDTRNDYISFLKEQIKANRSLSSALRFVDVAGVRHGRFADEAERLSLLGQIARTNLNDDRRPANYTQCIQVFGNVTLYVNELMKTENVIQELIIERLRALVWTNTIKITALIAVIAVALLLSILIITFVVSFINDTHVTIVQLLEKNDMLEEAKRETIYMLTSMFPAVVVNQLQQQQTVGMEHFVEVTVLFADMVGFTTISSLSTPEQVYNMLNFLFMYVDERIKRRDVFKVQTIGDAYLVASGMPVKNGKKHVTEIALLALDLQADLCKLEIPHMSGVNFNLRIGIATGSVLAGVVDKKTPRYCLLGDTLQKVVHLEETGEGTSTSAAR
ncbi:hypothetical protein LSAT2_018450 [Lamellibrachia satsuma]|nr:hypothetical protein LSAT2_018450 [Lamellibrachia satsuma]